MGTAVIRPFLETEGLMELWSLLGQHQPSLGALPGPEGPFHRFATHHRMISSKGLSLQVSLGIPWAKQELAMVYWWSLVKHRTQAQRGPGMTHSNPLTWKGYLHSDKPLTHLATAIDSESPGLDKMCLPALAGYSRGGTQSKFSNTEIPPLTLHWNYYTISKDKKEQIHFVFLRQTSSLQMLLVYSPIISDHWAH